MTGVQTCALPISDETLEACEKNGVTIQYAFGGNHDHKHFLGHPDPDRKSVV